MTWTLLHVSNPTFLKIPSTASTMDFLLKREEGKMECEVVGEEQADIAGVGVRLSLLCHQNKKKKKKKRC